MYEQPFHSHVYENQLELLLDYYTRTRSNTIPTEQEVSEAKTLKKPEKEQVSCSSTNHTYKNVPKEPPREKIWLIPFLLESPKSKEFQLPDLEIDFLIDSGAESNNFNIPTWNEIEILNPKLIPLKTTSKIATTQGSTLTNYGKSNFCLLSPKQWNKTNS